MASRRLTNNSVATLDEQSEVLQSILSKEKTVKEKKARKNKEKQRTSLEKKAKVSDKPAALGACMSDSNMADDDESLQSENLPTWAEAKALQSGFIPDNDYDVPDYEDEEGSIQQG